VPDSDGFQQMIEAEPFSLPQARKEAMLLAGFNALARHHYENSPEYARIIDIAWGGPRAYGALAEAPFLPVGLFKEIDLSSSHEKAMVLTSSGTTGQRPSRIIVDNETSARQAQALVASYRPILGSRRLPFLAIDTKDVIKAGTLTARGGGVLGMMKFGAKAAFALGADLKADRALIRDFIAANGQQSFFLFGFTFLVWTGLYQQFEDGELDLSNGTLIHSGGWKKLEAEAVSNKAFRAALGRRFNLTRIFNFYGFVEQMGSMFIEASDGLLYPPNFADVIIRHPETLEPLGPGEVGVIQVISLLPRSYPGHSVLTEDLGEVVTVDAGVDRRMGRAIRVHGRIKQAELRGCSDVIGTIAA
jgi:hypothetical protein